MKRILAIVTSIIIGAVSLMPVSIAHAVGTNLVANPGFEIAAGTVPSGWTSNKWGTSTANFTYDTTGRSGSRSTTVKVNGYVNGDAKWIFTPVNVTPGTKYAFSDWYKSTVATGVVAAITSTSNLTSYQYIAGVPASTVWKQQTLDFTAPANAKQVSFYHYLAANGTLTVDDYSLATIDSTVTPLPTAPTVSLTSPSAGATVNATQTVTANASDAKAVTQVQFKLDGANLGAADTTAPYSVSWDTKTAANGAHNLTAVATNNSSLSTTSAVVGVTVNNQTVTPPPPPPPSNNLIANASVETATGTTPTGWTPNSWGANTNALTYESNGQDGTRSLKATVTSYTNGDAKWYFTPVSVTPGKAYNYSEWYKSNVETEVDAMVTMNDGSVQYFYMGSVPANPSNWQKINLQFTPPAGAATVTVFHVIAKVGYIQSDNFSFSAYAPAQLNRPLVSLTFDDGWRSIYSNGLPALSKYGFVSTQYLNSEPVIGGYPDYMTYAHIKEFNAKGHELGWHTRSHINVTTLTTSQLTTELSIPAAFLQGIGLPASTFKHFATPFGAYNTSSVAEIRKTYASHRSTDVGYNTKDSFNLNNIKVQNILNTTTAADVQRWVNQAVADKSWLVIVYHEVGTVNEDPMYSVTPANLVAQLNSIKQSGVTVKTLGQAVDEITPQL